MFVVRLIAVMLLFLSAFGLSSGAIQAQECYTGIQMPWDSDLPPCETEPAPADLPQVGESCYTGIKMPWDSGLSHVGKGRLMIVLRLSRTGAGLMCHPVNPRKLRNPIPRRLCIHHSRRRASVSRRLASIFVPMG